MSLLSPRSEATLTVIYWVCKMIFASYDSFWRTYPVLRVCEGISVVGRRFCLLVRFAYTKDYLGCCPILLNCKCTRALRITGNGSKMAKWGVKGEEIETRKNKRCKDIDDG